MPHFVIALVLAMIGPSTNPATTPAGARPLDELRLAYHAMCAGRDDQLTARLYAPDDEHEKFVATLADAAKAVRELREATAGQLGLEAAAQVRVFEAPEIVAAFDDATEEVDGEIAIVHIQQMPLSMRRMNGQWALDISALTGGEPAEGVRWFRHIASSIRRVSGEVERGAYTSADEINRAVLVAVTPRGEIREGPAEPQPRQQQRPAPRSR